MFFPYKKNTYRLLCTVLCCVVYFSCASASFAASVTLVSSNTTGVVDTNTSFTVNLFVDSGNQAINALAGRLVFSKDLLEIKNISTENSIINLWMETPHEVATIDAKEQGGVVWGGIIPGGFNGTRSAFYEGVRPGLIFTVSFIARAPGMARISLLGLEARENDGYASPVVLSGNTLLVPIQVPSSSNNKKMLLDGTNNSTSILSDKISASIIRTPFIASNKWSVIFNTDTTRRSVDHYEIAETNDSVFPQHTSPLWYRATNPYILIDQTRSSFVYIKSVDTYGGEMYVSLPPESEDLISANREIYAILVVVLMCVGVLLYSIKLFHEKDAKNK